MKLRVGTTVLLLLAATACGQAATHTAAGKPVTTKPAATSAAAATPTALPSPTATRAATHRHPKQQEHLSQPIALPRCPHTSPSPHFDTPEAMMSYLATAWNHDDLDALCHVTNPNARTLLNEMHSEAVNLRLNHCERQAGSIGRTYVCFLDHDYPTSMRKLHLGHGHAVFDAAPADRPGWYMTVFESCG
jgi:hypothetical protein